MNDLSCLLTRYPGYSFSTQFSPASDAFNSIICFYNYYNQVFRDELIPVNLHLVFFDMAGREVHACSVRVEANETLQFNARANGISSDGMVAVAAIPEADIRAINNGRVKLKSPISTGFYITWEGSAGGRDIMHEWVELRSQVLGSKIHHVGFAHAEVEIKHGMVLMNSIFVKGVKSEPRLRLRVPGVSTPLAEVILDPINSMGTKIVKLDECFNDFSGKLAEYGKLVVDLEAENLSPPLTVEWHPSGDFHIHHL